MIQLPILIVAVCLLAVVIDWRRGHWITAVHLHHWFLSRGDRIVNTRTGRKYLVIGQAMNRDHLRIRRILR